MTQALLILFLTLATMVTVTPLAAAAQEALPPRAEPPSGPRLDPSPALPGSSILLKNTSYRASFNRAHKQADWVYYALGKNELRNCVQRNGSFRSDDRLQRGEGPELSDYSGSGFDRGHMSPAADNRWSAVAMRDSFLLTNVSPQPGRFNGGIWGRLEALVRAWALEAGGLFVTTGPLLKPKLPKIGSGVSVPEYFYKVLAARDGSKAVAFVLPADANGELTRYETSVDQLEEISGLDFLLAIPGEDELEKTNDASKWDLNARFTAPPCSGQAPDFSAAPGMLQGLVGLGPQ